LSRRRDEDAEAGNKFYTLVERGPEAEEVAAQ